MTVVTNNVGNLVFAVSTVGQNGPFYTQLDLSFGAGTNVTFDVSNPTIANRYILTFGTTRNGVPNESNIVVTRTTGKVVLAIPATYTGANIYYYSDISTVSAYETPVISLKGQDISGGFGVGQSSGLSVGTVGMNGNMNLLTFINAGVGMAGMTPDGNMIAFGLHNQPKALGIVCDYSNNRWVKSTTKNNNTTIQAVYQTAYQFDAAYNTGGSYTNNGSSGNPGFLWATGDYQLDDTGTRCILAGTNQNGGENNPGAFAVYELSNNFWSSRGTTGFFTTVNANAKFASSLDADVSFNAIVAGSKGGFIKIYNFASSTYTEKATISLGDYFGTVVRMNSAGTKILAVSCNVGSSVGGFAKIYTSADASWSSYTTTQLTCDGASTVTSNTNVFTPFMPMSNRRFISKALDVYLSVDSNYNINVYALDISSGIAVRRNVISEYMFWSTRCTSYSASLSGNGKRIFLIGGYAYNNPNGWRANIYDYHETTNSWSKTGTTLDTSSGVVIPRSINSGSDVGTSAFGSTVSMSFDGSTIAVGDWWFYAGVDATQGTGAFHVLKCVTPQTFS